jgi:hypothetical protein
VDAAVVPDVRRQRGAVVHFYNEVFTFYTDSLSLSAQAAV